MLKELIDIETDMDVFLYVSNHLLTQNKKAIHAFNGTCLYRADDGLKCAIGCLISDDYYDKKIEGQNLSLGVVIDCIVKSLKSWEINEQLLFELQEIHDNKDVINWKPSLDNLAKRFITHEGKQNNSFLNDDHF